MADKGFGTNDPVAALARGPGSELRYGYRDQSFRQHNSNFAGNTKALVEYNNFKFPPVCEIEASIVPEYDKTGRILKYQTLVVTVSCVITDYTIEKPDATNPTIDNEMEEIRRLLTQPRCVLKVQYQGLGQIVIGESTLLDIDNGPKPQVLEWESLGGGAAAHIQWLVTSRIAPCTTSPGAATFPFLSASYSSRVSLNEQGFLTRELKGEAEFAAGRNVSSGAEKAANSVSMTGVKERWRQAIDYFNQTFGDAEGFHRRTETSIDEAKRIIQYNVTETEIPSGTAYPKGAFDVDFEESVSSNLSEGFRKWTWNFSGSLRVSNTFNGRSLIPTTKASCYGVLASIIRERITRADALDAIIRKVPLEEAAQTPPQYRKITRIPLSVSISNELFGTGISLDVSYKLICSWNLLFLATGMFDMVQVPGLTWEEWQYWRQRNQPFGETEKLYINNLPGSEFLVDPCTSLKVSASSPPKFPSVGPRPSISIIDDTIPSEETSWIDYKVKWTIGNSTGTAIGDFLEVIEPANENINYPPQQGEQHYRNESQLEIDPTASDGDSASIDLQRNERGYVLVRMDGWATRLGYPINAPNLISVSGVKAYKYGTDILQPENQPLGFSGRTADGTNLGAVNLHKLRWSKTYVLDRVPQKWKDTITSGHPQFYV